jgi:hypothetical protein
MDLSKDSAIFKVSQRLKQFSVVRGEFEQEKNLKNFKKPLISKGEFIYSQKHGIYWHTSQPMDSSYLITQNGVFEKKTKEGSKPQDDSSKNMTSVFSQQFLSIFTAEIFTLEKEFSLFFSYQGEKWFMGLLPKKKAGKQFIQAIVLHGEETLQGIQFLEEKGNSTALTFLKTETAPGVLTSKEEELFRR